MPHQGVIATVSRTRYWELPTLLEKVQRRNKTPVFVMLDSVQDPRNLGAILRTAEATDVDAVLIPKNNAVSVTAAVHKASAGASDYVPISKVTNVARTLETLKAAGVWVVGSAEEAETCLYRCRFDGAVMPRLGRRGGRHSAARQAEMRLPRQASDVRAYCVAQRFSGGRRAAL